MASAVLVVVLVLVFVVVVVLVLVVAVVVLELAFRIPPLRLVVVDQRQQPSLVVGAVDCGRPN